MGLDSICLNAGPDGLSQAINSNKTDRMLSKWVKTRPDLQGVGIDPDLKCGPITNHIFLSGSC